MKFTSGSIWNEIRQNHVNNVTPVLTAEWNMNRYFRAYADNTPEEQDEAYDSELFPIESIVIPDRPKAGIIKALVNQSFVGSNNYDGPPSARYYTVSPDSQYKYWQSPVKAGASAPFNFANHTDSISKVRPRVEYVEEAIDPEDVDEARVGILVTGNKIRYTVENTWSTPDSYDVQIKTTVGGSWTTIASNVAVPAGGRVELYYNGTAWTTTVNLNNPISIHAVQLVVNSMDKANAYFNLIELGVYLELDLSADISSLNDEASMGEVDYITPLGTISSNTGSVTLFNETRLYTNDNESSTLFGLLDKNVKFNMKYSYAGGLVQQFVLYSDTWTENLEETTVNLTDGSKFFMDVKPKASLYRNIPVQEAVWRLCDLVGFTDYVVESVDDTPNSIIDIFWTTGEQTLWEVFQELSKGTQSAIYFDSWGRLRVKTREAAFNDGQADAWTALENQSGTSLPDIISASETDQYEANKVTVTYQPTSFAEQVGNITPMEVVWEPEGPVVLRASDLIKNMTTSSTEFVVMPGDARIWPFKGICQIEGEWIRYGGKRYVYYDGNTKVSTIVVSDAHQRRLDAKSTAANRHLNAYTGAINILERGLWNTEKQNHVVDASGWTIYQTDVSSGLTHTPARGFKHNSKDSTVTLEKGKNGDMNKYTMAVRGGSVNQGYRRIGTKMKIDATAHRDKAAGIFFNAEEIGMGYFVEVMPTVRMDANMRKVRNEVILYSMKDDGTKQLFGGEKVVSRDRSKSHPGGSITKTDLGAEVAVLQNRWLEIDIYFTVVGDDHGIQVWVNGVQVISAVVPNGSGWRHDWVDRFGMYVRGNSQATFEYIYGITKPDILYDDEETFLDRISGGYVGEQWSRDYVYEVRNVRKKFKKKSRKVAQRYQQRFFDEFGPIVHEVREFDVKFATDGLPVLESKLFHTNQSQAVCTEYTGDISGAKFIMANTSRQFAVLNGEDVLTTQGVGTIDQKLFVYGRPVIQKDSKTVVRRDEWAIRRRGEIETEYQSKWIQNSAEAEALAEWLTTHWTRSDSVLDLEIFGNPLIEIGDIVAVDYQEMTAATHKYYVTGIRNSFDAGITTELTLRRVSN